MESHIENLQYDFNWNGTLSCPCGDKKEFKKIDWKFSKNLIFLRSSRNKMNEVKLSHFDIAEQNILTLKCPYCSRAFIDFNACCAILCECGNHFCGLCLEKCDDNTECHKHVMSCKLNIKEDYFMSWENWNMIQYKSKRKKIWMLFWDIFKEYGLIYTIGFMYNINTIFNIVHNKKYINDIILFVFIPISLYICLYEKLILSLCIYYGITKFRIMPYIPLNSFKNSTFEIFYACTNIIKMISHKIIFKDEI
jgi:hypothetical protein